MAAMFTDDPNELNKRYMPKDGGMYEDDEEYIPEEELTEEEREMMKTIGSLDWKIILGWAMDEEDYTLSDEEFGAKCLLGNLNSINLPGDDNEIYQYKLDIANTITPKDAFYVIERLKKKPEEGVNIPPEILDIIYTKAKEYKR
jgi:hypothetical protein